MKQRQFTLVAYERWTYPRTEMLPSFRSIAVEIFLPHEEPHANGIVTREFRGTVREARRAARRLEVAIEKDIN
jgi:hypothetical protein